MSLSVDAILAEKVATDAAEPLGVPVFPRMNYGLCPYFTAYPGSVTLRVETLLAVVRDILDSLAQANLLAGRPEAAEVASAESVALWDERGLDQPDYAIFEGVIFTTRGRALTRRARYDEAESALRRALDVALPRHRADVIAALVELETIRGDPAAAERWRAEAAPDP